MTFKFKPGQKVIISGHNYSSTIDTIIVRADNYKYVIGGQTYVEQELEEVPGPLTVEEAKQIYMAAMGDLSSVLKEVLDAAKERGIA